MIERTWMRSYTVEMMVSMAVYVALLVVSLRVGPTIEAGVLRVAVMVAPMFGFALMLRAIVRHLRRIDEFMRQNILENTAMAAAITAGITFTYGFLENAGYPKLSMFTVWPLLAGAWGVVAFGRAWMARWST